MEPWTLAPGLALTAIGLWLNWRARHKLPDIRTEWQRYSPDNPSGGQYGRVIRIWQEGPEPKWELHKVSIKGSCEEWLSLQMHIDNNNRFSNPKWIKAAEYELPIPLLKPRGFADNSVLILLHPDAPKWFSLALILKPSGGCLIPYRKTYTCIQGNGP